MHYKLALEYENPIDVFFTYGGPVMELQTLDASSQQPPIVYIADGYYIFLKVQG